MGDGIFNFANLGWLIVLAGAYYGIIQYEKIPPQVKNRMQDILDRIGVISPVYVVVALWMVMRIMWSLGWQLQVEMVIVLSTCNYVYRQTSRVRKNFYFKLHQEIAESEDPTRILGNNLPEWVTFPSANRVQFINTLIESLWPSIVGATDRTIRDVLPPILERSKPSGVYGFKIKATSIGKNPIIVNGVQHHQYGASETMLDLNVSWNADMDIRLVIAVPGPDVEVRVKDFEMRMTIRVTLGPLIPQWPCFANIVLSLVGQPDMDFDITAGKVPLDSVPGLGSFLDNFIRHTLVGLMAYPKGITVPIVQGYKIDVGKAAGALGTLKLHFLRVDNFLPKFNKYKKTPFYMKIEMIDSGVKRIRGKSYTGLTSSMSDTVSYTLYDNTGSLRVWLYFDVVGADICVGICDVTTYSLINQDPDEEMELIMCKASDAAHRRRCSIFVKGEFLPFEHQSAGNSLTDAPPAALPSRDLSPEFIEEAQKNGAPLPPSSRSGTPRSAIKGSSNTGVLFVSVASAANLRNREKVTTSDPYLFLRVGRATAKSNYISSNLNPVFNFEAELNVENAEKDVFKLSIIDKNDGRKDKLMGEMSIDMSTIQNSKNSQITGEFELVPQGTVVLTARFLSH